MSERFVPEKLHFKTAEEEIAFLRKELSKREAISLAPEKEPEALLEEVKRLPETVLDPVLRIDEKEEEGIVLALTPEPHDKAIEEILGIMMERGVKNALLIAEKTGNPHLVDDLHRFLIQYLRSVPMNADSETMKIAHMKLLQVALPRAEEKNISVRELISKMEQFYAGMLSLSDGKDPLRNNYFTVELAQNEKGADIVFYVGIPDTKESIFEKQLSAVFPGARIEEKKDDYNIFNDVGATAGAIGVSLGNPLFPIATYERFDEDPLRVIVNVFSRLKESGEGAAIQFVVVPAGDTFMKKYSYILDEIRKGKPVKEALAGGSFGKVFGKAIGDLVLGPKAKKEEKDPQAETATKEISEKIKSTIVNTNIRILSSAETQGRAEEILSEIRSAFNQFNNTQGNGIAFEEKKGRELVSLARAFSYRLFDEKESFPLNLRELTTLVHFSPPDISPQVLGAKSSVAPAPQKMDKDGVILGINEYRGIKTDVYMGREDRLRHLYVIGQTGTGKTTLLKNMIIQDIARGEGVCMIDPHGADLEDILASIPEERINDVIYFDPSHTERPLGLNMLEYDSRFPEQKTFVVNELLSIFNKLFDMKTAGGPLFEQYFRNAALLSIDDPSTGATLLEISRVMSDKAFRDMKLSTCTNPLVVQFWREVATKAGGDASLANLVPYITSKFDVFLTNDIMRPIIAQERSAFNFKDVMDQKKILLVNLSKGRLGDINSHLIGLIIVGKILMASLSRTKGMHPPFYLYIDEFQNVTTDSIATIFSEARKYGLSLTVAHQFISQLPETIKGAVFGNVGSLAVFRVGAEDGEFLGKQFAPVFTPEDLINLENRKASIKMLVNGEPTRPFSLATLPPPPGNKAIVEKIKQNSYASFGKPRQEVEEAIMKKYRKDPPQVAPNTVA